MAFMTGFAKGFQQGFSNEMERIEHRKILFGEQEEKKRATLERLRPKAAENLAEINRQKTKLEYLQNVRKLPADRIAALSEDPDVLDAAYKFATEGQGVDMTPEELSEVYRAVPLGNIQPGQDPFELLNSQAELYRDMVEGGDIDPNAFIEPMTRERQYTVETRVPQKPEEVGVSAMTDRTWKLQESAFDKAVLTFANSEITRLDKKSQTGEITPEESERLAQLNQFAGDYNSDLFANEQLRKTYGQQAAEAIKNSQEFGPDFLAGFEQNPLIFDYGQEARDAVEQRLEQLDSIPEGAVLTHKGVDPDDGKMTYFYRLSDGSTKIVKE